MSGVPRRGSSKNAVKVFRECLSLFQSLAAAGGTAAIVAIFGLLGVELLYYLLSSDDGAVHCAKAPVVDDLWLVVCPGSVYDGAVMTCVGGHGGEAIAQVDALFT